MRMQTIKSVEYCLSWYRMISARDDISARVFDFCGLFAVIISNILFFQSYAVKCNYFSQIIEDKF
jgi:hypothetical protein